MTKKANVNRRTILKSISAGASVGLAGYVGSASAREVGPNEREAILEDPNVKIVLNEVGNPEIIDVSASTAVVDETELSLKEITTEIGSLQIAESSGVETSYVFTFDVEADQNGANRNRSRSKSSTLPEKYRAVPNLEETVVSVSDGTPLFTRQATETERAELESILGSDLDDAVAGYNSYSGGFEIISAGGKQVVPATRNGEITDQPRPIVSAQDCDHGACVNCALTIGAGSGTCGWVCKAANLAGIKGKVACLGCLAAAGYTLSKPCQRCLDTCG